MSTFSDYGYRDGFCKPMPDIQPASDIYELECLQGFSDGAQARTLFDSLEITVLSLLDNDGIAQLTDFENFITWTSTVVNCDPQALALLPFLHKKLIADTRASLNSASAGARMR